MKRYFNPLSSAYYDPEFIRSNVVFDKDSIVRNKSFVADTTCSCEYCHNDKVLAYVPDLLTITKTKHVKGKVIKRKNKVIKRISEKRKFDVLYNSFIRSLKLYMQSRQSVEAIKFFFDNPKPILRYKENFELKRARLLSVPTKKAINPRKWFNAVVCFNCEKTFSLAKIGLHTHCKVRTCRKAYSFVKACKTCFKPVEKLSSEYVCKCTGKHLKHNASNW